MFLLPSQERFPAATILFCCSHYSALQPAHMVSVPHPSLEISDTLCFPVGVA